MAKIDTTGFEDVERAFLKREGAAAEAVPEMLKAGAEVLINAQRSEMDGMGLVDFGDMAGSINAAGIKNDGAGASIEIYPRGNDRKGVSNATKAFVHEYGKSNLPARPWMASANAKCAEEVHDAMRKVWEAMTNA